MAEVHNLLDDMAKACENIVEGHGPCGSTKFNILKSGKIECVACGDKEETQVVINLDSLPKFNNYSSQAITPFFDFHQLVFPPQNLIFQGSNLFR